MKRQIKTEHGKEGEGEIEWGGGEREKEREREKRRRRRKKRRERERRDGKAEGGLKYIPKCVCERTYVRVK